MTGSTFKRCACRNPETGKQYGQSCPKLTQKRHGLWNVRQELPLREDGTRRTFRRSGYTSKNDAQNDLDRIRTLLKIPGNDDAEGRVRIGDLLEAVASGKEPIPDYEETKRKFGTGQSLTVHTTVGEWLELWLAGKKRLRKSGKDRYETDIRVHLEPRIGRIRLDRLRVQHLDEMFAGIAETNIEINDANIMRRAAIDELATVPWKGTEYRARRKALKETIAAMPPFRRITGPSTQSHIRATLRAALNDAIAQGYITFNPAQHVELVAAKRPKALVWTEERVEEWIRTGEKPSPVMVWTPEQAGQFLDFIAEDRLFALFRLITFRGLRRGEACGVRKQDLNVQALTLTVATQLVQDGWEVVESDPKTDSGARVVHLDEETVDTLRAHLAKQAADRLSWGEAWQDTGRIFTQENGEWLHPGWLTDYFERLVEASGLPPIRLHDLRHLAATLMLAAGVDVKIVSETLGHGDSRITRDIYQSVLPKVGAEAAEATARMVPRATTSKAARTAGLTSGSHAHAEIVALPGPSAPSKEKAQVRG
ncbi:tyrosine-type recombinase/integrase [Streptoverticillium reticulum]|uniref:tyrosine-type recombinase/integrase n=1 Tax=Streptoverticillium reticulum TaxID=1433415 RepID=UPI0039BEF20C